MLLVVGPVVVPIPFPPLALSKWVLLSQYPASQPPQEDTQLWLEKTLETTFSERRKLQNFTGKKKLWGSWGGSAETNLTRNHEVEGSIPGLAQWVKDLALLWCRPAAVALIRLPVWEPPYAASAALKRQRKKKFVICVSWAEFHFPPSLCPPPPQSSGFQNVAVFEDQVFKEVIKFKQSPQGGL